MHLSLAVVDRYYFNIENVSKKLVIIGLFRKAGIKPQPAAAAAVVWISPELRENGICQEDF